MTIDLSAILPAPTAASAHAEFVGTPLPSLSASTFARRLQPECRACPKATSHLSWMGHGPKITPTGTWKAAQEEAIATVNTALERRFRQQSLVQLMDRWANAVRSDASADIEVSSVFSWTVTAISGNRISCSIGGGDTSPELINWVTLAYNPYTGTSATSSHYGKLPMRGMLTLGNTIGDRRRRFFVRKLENITSSSFDFIIEGTTGAAEDALDPAEDIIAVYTVYLEMTETFVKPRRIHPFWAKHRTKAVAYGSFTANYPLTTPANADCAIFYPAGASAATVARYFSVVAYYASGAVEDVSASTPVTVSHSGASAYQTLIDLSALASDGTITQVAISYWYESADTDAICLGQDRCAWSHEEPTGTYGTAEGDSTFYCGRPYADPDQATLRATHRPKCMQTACSGWAVDVLTNPFTPALPRQIVYGEGGVTWMGQQANPGSSRFYTTLMGPPSLASLAGLDMAVPDGFHALRIFPANGGWEAGVEYADLLYQVRGLETLIDRVGTVYDYSSIATHPPYGPAGNTWDKRREIGDSLLDDSAAPGYVRQAIALAAGVAIHPYSLLVVSGLGLAMRCGLRTQHILIPRATPPAATRPDGALEYGPYDATFNRQDAADESTVWGALLDFKQLRLDRQWSTPHAGLVATPTVFAASWDDSAKRLTLELDNGLETCSSFVSVGLERQSVWRQGGTWVEPPERQKNRNWATSFMVGVDERKIKQGMVAELPAAMMSVFGADAEAREVPRRFAIMEAEAFAGSTEQSVIPGDFGGPGYKLRGELPGTGVIWVPFTEIPETETIFDADGDHGITAWYQGDLLPVGVQDAGPPRTYYDETDGATSQPAQGNLIAIEGVRQVLDGSEVVSERGVWLILSQLNLTSATALSWVWVSIPTYDLADSYASVHTYGTGSYLDFYDSGYLANSSWSVPGSEGVDQLDSVEVILDALDADGEPITRELTLHAGDPPAPHLWPGVDHCYVQVGATIGDCTFWTHNFYAGATARVNYTPDYTGITDAGWIADEITFHGERDASGSLAIDWASFARYGDALVIQDEGGVIEALWDAGGEAAFLNQAIPVYRELVAHPADASHEPVLTTATRNSATADATLTRGTDYIYFGAAGRLFLSKAIADALTSEDCLALVAHLADRRGHPLEDEELAITRTLQALLYDNGLWCNQRFINHPNYPVGREELMIGFECGLYVDAGAIAGTTWISPTTGTGWSLGLSSMNFGGSAQSSAAIGQLGVWPGLVGGVFWGMARGAFYIDGLENMTADSIRDARCNVTLGSLTKRTTTTTYAWTAVEAGATLEDLTDPPVTNKWYHEDQVVVDATTGVDASIALAAVYPDGTGAVVHVISGAGLGNTWDSGDVKVVDVTGLVRAYLAAKADGAIGFELLIVGGPFGVTEGNEGTEDALLDLIDSYVQTPGYTVCSPSALYVLDIANTANFFLEAYADDETVAVEYAIGNVTLGKINVRIDDALALDVNARVFYGVPPAQP